MRKSSPQTYQITKSPDCKKAILSPLRIASTSGEVSPGVSNPGGTMVSWKQVLAMAFGAAAVLLTFVLVAHAELPSDEKIADAIYLAEGGDKTSHPYGILVHYEHTTPRQACINTIRHAKKDWDGQGDFIEFLGSRYAPIGADNDPQGLNKNWVKNVKYFLRKDK